MLTTIYSFLHMQGYGLYVWPAYLIVFISLSVQWLIPWRRWRHYLRTQDQNNHESLT